MKVTFSSTAAILEKTTSDLEAVARATEREIQYVAKAFEGLTEYTDTILQLTSSIVASVEGDNVSSVLPTVKTLGTVAERFIEERLRATSGILDMVSAEVVLLRKLSVVTRGQSAIARKTQALSVLTNIEVAYLGAAGTSFKTLAQQLTEFAQSLTDNIRQLERHTDDRRGVLEETRSNLTAELPRQRQSLARFEVDLTAALAAAESGLTSLLSAPEQFRTGVRDLALQVAGVVSAVQAHDITRQQIEHVQEALTLIAERIRASGDSEDKIANQASWACAGLGIQIYQLRIIKETVTNWGNQIKTCMDGILTVSASEVVGIGPTVLEQEKEVSSQLARIELLERTSQAYSDNVRGTLGGLSTLLQLVKEHQQRSNSVRDSLQLLTFNSIIEAGHIGTRANAILAIAKNIENVSTEWNEITAQSGLALQEILQLVERTNQLMEAFSEASSQALRDAQLHTRSSLENLRVTAVFAASQAQKMKVTTQDMQAHIGKVGSTGNMLAACFGHFDEVLSDVEKARQQLEFNLQPGTSYDPAEVERLFSASYTTELEREVMHAALRGTALPTLQQSFAGNSVELF
jgi:hypothetical protein